MSPYERCPGGFWNPSGLPRETANTNCSDRRKSEFKLTVETVYTKSNASKNTMTEEAKDTTLQRSDREKLC